MYFYTTGPICIVYTVPTLNYLLYIVCVCNMHATPREKEKKEENNTKGKKLKKPPSLIIFLLIPLGVMSIYSRKYFMKNNLSKVLWHVYIEINYEIYRDINKILELPALIVHAWFRINYLTLSERIES